MKRAFYIVLPFAASALLSMLIIGINEVYYNDALMGYFMAGWWGSTLFTHLDKKTNLKINT